MATAYQASCTSCTWTSRHTTHADARATADVHACGPRVCGGCGGGFQMLVEGSDMCLSCDVRFYPVDGEPGNTGAPAVRQVPLIPALRPALRSVS